MRVDSVLPLPLVAVRQFVGSFCRRTRAVGAQFTFGTSRTIVGPSPDVLGPTMQIQHEPISANVVPDSDAGGSLLDTFAAHITERDYGCPSALLQRLRGAAAMEGNDND